MLDRIVVSLVTLLLDVLSSSFRVLVCFGLAFLSYDAFSLSYRNNAARMLTFVVGPYDGQGD